MNETIKNFLDRCDINVDKISQTDARIFHPAEINSIVYHNLISKGFSRQQVCVADVLGYDYYSEHLNNNFFDNLSYFFDAQSTDNYQRRSVSLLDYASDEVIEKTCESFQKDPTWLTEIDAGKYVVGENGLHRFHLLKAHYLGEKSKLENGDEKGLKSLNEKYTFETYVREVDFKKTYTASVLRKISDLTTYDRSLRIDADYNDEGVITGKTSVKSKRFGERVVDDEEFLSLVKNSAERMKFFENAAEYFSDWLVNACQRYKTFKKFCDENATFLYNFLNKEKRNEN